MLATILGDEVDQRLTEINPYSKAIESNLGSDFYPEIKINPHVVGPSKFQ